MAGDLYADRDHMAQGHYYLRHIDRMTREGLHAKSAIAGELAHRDIRIDALTAERDALQAKVEAMEAENFSLAAGLCIVHPGVTGDDGGTPQCPLSELRAAALAVIQRWDTPLWKDAPATAEYINRLRNAAKGAS